MDKATQLAVQWILIITKVLIILMHKHKRVNLNDLGKHILHKVILKCTLWY